MEFRSIPSVDIIWRIGVEFEQKKVVYYYETWTPICFTKQGNLIYTDMKIWQKLDIGNSNL